jgi:hypothetical protein
MCLQDRNTTMFELRNLTTISPSEELEPSDVIVKVLEALRLNDEPHPDHGIEVSLSLQSCASEAHCMHQLHQMPRERDQFRSQSCLVAHGSKHVPAYLQVYFKFMSPTSVMYGFDLPRVAHYIKTSKDVVLTRWDALNYVRYDLCFLTDLSTYSLSCQHSAHCIHSLNDKISHQAARPVTCW